MKILVVEDEKELLESIAEGLSLSGYIVDTCDNGFNAEEMCYVENYDLMVLDINLPGQDGFSILEKVREFNKELNIIVLTARSDVDDRVKGLDLGANDYLIKPFHFEELEARIRVLLRRRTIQEDRLICNGPIKFDTKDRTVYINDYEVKLTGKETGILEYLLLNPNRYISQEEILEHVWENSVDLFSNTVRVHMASLRKKLKNILGKNIIINELGKGYKLNEE